MKILIASPIYPGAIEKLREDHDVICAFNAKEDELLAVMPDREAVILRSGVQITAKVMACAPNLKLILRAGSGFDNIDLDYMREHGLKLVRIPGPGARAVAELSFTFMLAMSRSLLEADNKTRRGVWAKHQLAGSLLVGKRLGVIGAGNIGTAVGKLGVAWGMDVIGCVAFPSDERAKLLADAGIRMTDIEEVLSTSDYVSIHVPLMDSTHDLVDAKALALMKPTAFLVTLARGGVVNETALKEALVNGRLAGAALDVHVNEGPGKISPLADMPNVILTPHIGSSTIDSQRQIGDIIIKTLIEEESRHPVMA